MTTSTIPLAPSDPTAALPVELAVRTRLLDPLRRMVEGQLGWQPVDDDLTGLVPPAVRLADTHADPSSVPTVLLLVDDDDPFDAARAVHRSRPVAVARWPLAPRDLAAHATAASRARSTAVASALVLRLGGAGGGVGTTTVAVALAALAAWHGTATLLGSGDATALPPQAPVVDPPALAAPDLWSRAVPVVAGDRCRAVRLAAGPREVEAVDPRIELLILDVGVADDVDVLVCCGDARGLAALERTTAATVVTVGVGGLPPREVARAIGHRRHVSLPWSTRVARASALGRAPTSLPGRFVQRLGPLLPAWESHVAAREGAARPRAPS